MNIKIFILYLSFVYSLTFLPIYLSRTIDTTVIKLLSLDNYYLYNNFLEKDA